MSWERWASPDVPLTSSKVLSLVLWRHFKHGDVEAPEEEATQFHVDLSPPRRVSRYPRPLLLCVSFSSVYPMTSKSSLLKPRFYPFRAGFPNGFERGFKYDLPG